MQLDGRSSVFSSRVDQLPSQHWLIGPPHLAHKSFTPCWFPSVLGSVLFCSTAAVSPGAKTTGNLLSGNDVIILPVKLWFLMGICPLIFLLQSYLD